VEWIGGMPSFLIDRFFGGGNSSSVFGMELFALGIWAVEFTFKFRAKAL
jgi:hypothetical protein